MYLHEERRIELVGQLLERDADQLLAAGVDRDVFVLRLQMRHLVDRDDERCRRYRHAEIGGRRRVSRAAGDV